MMPQKSTKSNHHQLYLLDEKRAFVVIALTDRLTFAGKMAAFNCLAHYNSEVGHSWASIPTIAKESGLSPSSTKTITRGLDEIVEVKAFKVTKGTPRKGNRQSTHHYCPIMQWFRDEYERLRKAGRLEQDNDEFEDVREQNRSGPQPDQEGQQPDGIGSTTRRDRADNPMGSGPQPEEECRLKRTDIREQKETKNASGGGPADSSIQRNKQTNDSKPVDTPKRNIPEKSIQLIFDQFWNKYPRRKNREEAYSVFRELVLAGEIESSKFMTGLNRWTQNLPDDLKYVPYPAKWLRGRGWEEFQNVNLRQRCRAAI